MPKAGLRSVGGLACLLAGSLCAGAGSPAAHAQASADIELLHNVPSTVLVSSAIRNGKNRPEQLVDGQLDTAWNSQPGVADRSFIDFVVPTGSQVRAIKLTAGFPAQNEKGDLFLMNHRITQVQVFRNRVSIGTFPLDPKERGLQELRIDQPGGRYRIQILRTQKGTNARWTEACVSELQVYGAAPAGMQPKSTTPTVLVGNVIEPHSGPVSGIAAFCEKWDRQVEELKLDPDSVRKPYCREKASVDPQNPQSKPTRTRLGRGQSPFVSAQLVEIASSAWETLLGLQTATGWYFYPMFAGMDFDDPGCSGYEESTLLEFSGSAEQLVLRYRYVTVTHAFEDGDRGSRNVSEFKVVCTPGDGAGPLCLKQLVSLRWSSER